MQADMPLGLWGVADLMVLEVCVVIAMLFGDFGKPHSKQGFGGSLYYNYSSFDKHFLTSYRVLVEVAHLTLKLK